MVSLTFYGGVNEIGGNKILLEDEGARIWLDFGLSFKKGQEFYTGFLTARKSAGCADDLELGLIPRIKGLYSEEMLSCANLPYTEPEFDAIIISHAHMDHCAHLQYIDPKIPVYLGETTLNIIKTIEETNPGMNFGEHRYRTFRTGDKFSIGSVEIEPLHTDHCLVGDIFIQLGNGEITQIKDISKSSFISTIDFKENKINQAVALKSKHIALNIFKIKTRFGDIKSTGEHRFFCLDGINIVEKKVKDMKNGDFLVYIKEMSFDGKHQLLPKISVRKIVSVSKEGLKKLKIARKMKNLTQSQVAGLSDFYGDFERGRFSISMKNLEKILEFLGFEKNQFLEKYCKISKSITIPQKTSPEFFQLLGYCLGDGSWYPSKKSVYLEISDKDENNLKLYQKITENVFNYKGKIVKKHTNVLRLSTYIGLLFNEISPLIFSDANSREIPKIVHKATKAEQASFLRGLYDAEGSFRGHQIVLCSTSKNIIEVTKLLLLRFGILSSIYEFIEPISKKKAYHLNINYRDSIERFYKFIGFGSKAKQKKLKEFIIKNKKSKAERIDLIPFNGEILKKFLKDIGISTWLLQKNRIYISHYINGKHLMSRKKLKQLLDFLKKYQNKENVKSHIKKLETLLSSNIIFVPIKSIDIVNEDPIVYDLEVPGYSNFIANGFLVHNSVPGSYGFLIHTTKGTIVYTGDFRLHGPAAIMSLEFIKKAKEAKPIALIIEGTRVGRKEKTESMTEADVQRLACKILSKTKKFVATTFYGRDYDRIMSFYSAS
ncbi:MAG: LAGLIDADG family homing endonuclease, partial [Candidatus Aenigmatarchaeota archaeon]